MGLKIVSRWVSLPGGGFGVVEPPHVLAPGSTRRKQSDSMERRAGGGMRLP